MEQPQQPKPPWDPCPADPAAFLLQPPIFHPVLPYLTTIFDGLAPGRMISVQGVISVEAERFQVDFQVGPSVSPRADIGLHFNPRFRPHPHVIFNSLVEGRWMEETKVPNLPLKRGEKFHLLFLFEEHQAKVSINGHHFTQHPLKVPLAKIDTLGVFGDISVKTIVFLPNNPFGTSQPGYPACQPLFRRSASLVLPLTHGLLESFRPGDTITARGLLHQDAQEFCVRLRSLNPSRTLWSFLVTFTDRRVSWGSGTDGGLDSGVTLGSCFPFQPQRYFELVFLCEEGHVKVALNGTPFGQGPFSPPPATPDSALELTVSGDVTLYELLPFSQAAQAGGL